MTFQSGNNDSVQDSTQSYRYRQDTTGYYVFRKIGTTYSRFFRPEKWNIRIQRANPPTLFQ